MSEIKNATPLLFTSFKLGDLELPNRISVSPMCQYTSTNGDGLANDWHLVHIGSRATGGAGLVIVEATAVDPLGRISPWDLGLWSDEHIEPLARIVRYTHTHSNAKIGIQLAHAGRKASTSALWLGGATIPFEEGGWQPVAPSAVAYDEHSHAPHELSVDEIQEAVKSFKDAAIRAVKAGFDMVQLHGAHGYLIHEFLSPISNRRTDQYGGSFENRIRFLLEITRAVKDALPDNFPLTVRLSCQDWVNDKESWTLDQTVELSKKLKEIGVHAIDCSSAGLTPEQKIVVGKNYQVPFAERIRKEAEIPTFAVGGIETAQHAEEILQNQQADIINMARVMLREPYWALNAAYELDVSVEWPKQYIYGAKRKAN